MRNGSNEIGVPKHAERGTLSSYGLGFGLSILLTLAAYFTVTLHIFKGLPLMVSLIVMAVVQAFVQLVFFLHLGKESKPRWKLLAFGFMTMVLAIVVFGTLWIMHDLDYNLMIPRP